ncbi:hypothetical protein Undi14_07935 [Undibacterium sp. 14-3-2]|uniref:hypothetical protein n=1 Tax=Undibacterium sp. 14-3-2 TaxID=2800129 RepID=UPI001902EFF5|nr:hypothetical protein [Undibacterium sp. 14-3-2]MBK1889965.1 hypothetical protein [Undibacterium sp. 14-3-2]
MNKNIQRGLALVGAIAVSGSAMAAGTGPDFSTLTSAVDFSTVITAIMAISATLMGVYIAIKGAKTVVGMIKGK